MSVSVVGVIEGFYQRPWSHQQRLHLFSLMKKFGLNCYVYAPKDDPKHRSDWRVTLDDSEKARLANLVQRCRSNDVKFVYAISPGLDMVYSDPEELNLLKEKLEDIKQCTGCEHFALLFDDIDTELSHEEDVKAFESMAKAHVHVANEVYKHLGGSGSFLFCPLEYCSSRAVPNVKESEYLNTLGTHLDPNIDVFWTGSRVVPKDISAQEMKELRLVLRRKAVLWDNLHANDYDSDRTFLGPYSGRDDLDLKSEVKGILLNPNCEFGANINAFFSLGMWATCNHLDRFKVTEEGIQHFLEETRRATSVGGQDVTCLSSASQKNTNVEEGEVGSNQGKESNARKEELTVDDVELLFHLFWLPHSHGPRGERLLRDFQYMLHHAHLVSHASIFHHSKSESTSEKDKEDDENKGSEDDEDKGSGDDDSDDSGKSENTLNTTSLFLSDWLERAANFSKECRNFNKLQERIGLINNRELLFDLTPYMNTMSLALNASNRFLKWCIDPKAPSIKGGPSLVGLQGGLAGDIFRLYPVKSNDEFPLNRMRDMHRSWLVTPLVDTDEIEVVRKHFQELCLRVAFKDLKDKNKLGEEENKGKDQSDKNDGSNASSNYVLEAYFNAYVNELDSQVVVIHAESSKDNDIFKAMSGVVLGTSNVASVVKTLQKLSSTPTAPSKKLNSTIILPWRLIETCDIIISVVLEPRLLFSSVAVNAIRTLLLLIKKNKKERQEVCLIVENGAVLLKRFLTSTEFGHCRFHVIFSGQNFSLLCSSSSKQ